jgi:hypothetical protein
MKSIAETYIASAEWIAAHLLLPPVHALHLPAAVAPTSKDGEFAVLELEDGSRGFTYVWLGDTLGAMRCDAWVEQVKGQAVLTLVRGYGMSDPARRTPASRRPSPPPGSNAPACKSTPATARARAWLRWDSRCGHWAAGCGCITCA